MALLISLLTFAVPLTLVYYLYKHLNNQRLARQYGCRAPKAYPHLDPVFGLDLFGKTLLAVRRHSHIEETHARFARHGSTYRAVSLGMNVFNTIDPINIRTIYSTESLTVWGAEPMRLPAMEPMCGRGFITTDGDSWQKARSMLKPSFNKARVEDLAVFGGMIDTFIANLPKDGATVDMIPQLYNLFLDSAGVFLVGSGFGAVSKDQSKSTDDAPVDPQSFLDAFHSAEIWMGIRMIFGALGRLAPTGRWMKQVRMVHDFVDHTVDQAMDKGSVDEQARHTLLKSLASQTSDRHEIRYQIIQALMATQDTTSTLLSNALFCLSRDPTMWARLREEALAMSSPPTPAELKKSRLIANIMNEAFRLYPPFPLHHRIAKQNTTLPSGGGPSGNDPIFVPKGSRATTCTYSIHRDRAVFGDDIESFRPDRWETIKPEPWEFTPFGYGARKCLGEDKARLEAAYALARFGRAFEQLLSRDDRGWKGESKLSVRNAHGVLVAFLA